ncbi:hypothetical protein ACFQZJ_02045 [Maribacter chungangensis]|uniref:Fibronectin type-III domain-containing protein n=1 Tax=Maribacter chungangensis TaxID=1069117 RepID=A0ABW3AZE5_9FLAO
MTRTILLLCAILTLSLGCRKNREPKPPGQVQLVFPDKNSECTTGQSLGATTSRVTFRWQEADNVQTYELRVTNLNTGSTQTISTAATSANLPIEKGTPFSWQVRSRNNQVQESVSSEVWSFYNSGSTTSFVPFPADIISPRMSQRVFKDINNETILSWSASDLDNDIDSFEVYLSTENPPEDLKATLGANTLQLKVSVASNTVYYWSVITTDAQGNATSSGVYTFKIL